MADSPTKAEMLSRPRGQPTGSGDEVLAVIAPGDFLAHCGALKRPDGNLPDWHVLLPHWIGPKEQWDLHLLAADQMDFLKIPEWRRYDAIAYSYSAGKAFYGDKMTFGIFMQRLRDCKIPEPNKTVELDFLAEINAVVENNG